MLLPQLGDEREETFLIISLEPSTCGLLRSLQRQRRYARYIRKKLNPPEAGQAADDHSPARTART